MATFIGWYAVSPKANPGGKFRSNFDAFRNGLTMLSPFRMGRGVKNIFTAIACRLGAVHLFWI